MSSSDLNTLKQRLREFSEARDWDQFHSPKNLSMALSAEVAEIVEHFQWLTREHIKEISDVLSNDGVWLNTEVITAVGEKLNVFNTIHFSLFVIHCFCGVWLNTEVLTAVGEK